MKLRPRVVPPPPAPPTEDELKRPWCLTGIWGRRINDKGWMEWYCVDPSITLGDVRDSETGLMKPLEQLFEEMFFWSGPYVSYESAVDDRLLHMAGLSK